MKTSEVFNPELRERSRKRGHLNSAPCSQLWLQTLSSQFMFLSFLPISHWQTSCSISLLILFVSNKAHVLLVAKPWPENGEAYWCFMKPLIMFSLQLCLNTIYFPFLFFRNTVRAEEQIKYINTYKITNINQLKLLMKTNIKHKCSHVFKSHKNWHLRS